MGETVDVYVLLNLQRGSCSIDKQEEDKKNKTSRVVNESAGC